MVSSIGDKYVEMKEKIEQLVTLARQARKKAYAPYSHYAVGAVVLTQSGNVYAGCNIENAAYPSGLCAERVAIFKAVSEGEREIVALVVVTANMASPCGACRQVLAEFASDDTLVVLAPARGKQRRIYRMADVLPERFGARHLSARVKTDRQRVL